MKNLLYIFLTLFLSINAYSQEKNLSDGPFDQLIIRGVTLINGNGSPPVGPVDIVIENNIIKSIRNVGYPGVEIAETRRPKVKKNGREKEKRKSKRKKSKNYVFAVKKKKKKN